MATVKGITVQIDGNTTGLSKALENVNKSIRETQSSLKSVNSALKLDPTNVELLTSKQNLLKEQIDNTESKLKSLKDVKKQVDEQFKNGELGQDKYVAFQTELSNTEAKLKSLQEEAKKTSGALTIDLGNKLQSVGGKMEDAGKKMTIASTALVGLGTIAVNTASNFEQSMANVQAISGATTEEIEKLSEKAREMASQTKFSASESADAMSYMAMAGWKTQDMLDGISGIMNLASASGADLAKTSDILTDGLTAFGLTAKESARMADVMAAASSNANTNVELLGESYKYCASTAGAMGYSIEDITESLGLMANAGVKGSQAGTTLKNAMINLAKPTDAMEAIMQKYNISLTDNQDNMKSWNEIVDDMRENLGNLAKDEQTAAVATLFGKEATAGMLSVINSAPQDIEKLNKAINESSGKAKEMSDIMNDNLNGQLTILKSKLEELAIAMGEIIMPIVKKVVDIAQKVVDYINNLSDSQKELIVKIGAVVTAIGPLLLIGGKLITTLGSVMTALGGMGVSLTALSGPIGIAIALIGSVVVAIAKLYASNEEFRNNVNKLISNLVNGLKNIIEPFISNMKNVITNFLNIIQSLVKIFSSAMVGDWQGMWDAFVSIFKNIWKTFESILQTSLNLMIDLVSSFSSVLFNTAKALFNMILVGFKEIWSNIWSWITNSFNSLVDKIGSFASSLYDKGKKIFSSLLDGMKNVWSSIKSWVSDCVSWLSNKLAFWKKTQNEMSKTDEKKTTSQKADGSHANGLDYVPFDGYKAILHKGERVLTAKENEVYTSGTNSNSLIINQNVYAPTSNARDLSRATRREFVKLGLGV